MIAQPLADKPLNIGNFTFQSRLITGTGKYSSYGLMRDCLAASGCEVTTVAVRAMLGHATCRIRPDSTHCAACREALECAPISLDLPSPRQGALPSLSKLAPSP